MPGTDERPLTVGINSKGCDVPADERDRMHARLAEVRRAVEGHGPARVWVNAVRYPRSQDYHVEAKLKLPRRTLFSGGRGPLLERAFQAIVDGRARGARACSAGP